MRAEVEQLLAPIVAALNKGDAVAKDLWDILSALRGPDVPGKGDLKSLTTARLRYAIGIRANEMSRWEGKAYAVDGFVEVNALPLPTQNELETLEKTEPFHFIHHFRRAVEAVRATYAPPADGDYLG